MDMPDIGLNPESASLFQALFNKVKSILKLFKGIYCSTKEDQQLFMNFSFIYLRGIVEFSKLAQIHSKITSNFPLTVKDEIANIF